MLRVKDGDVLLTDVEHATSIHFTSLRKNLLAALILDSVGKKDVIICQKKINEASVKYMM